MASPTIVSSATTAGSAVASPVPINLPASISSGDLLVALIRLGTNATITFPGGWNALKNEVPDSDSDTVAIAWREADGSEGATFDLTVSASAKAAAIVYRITGAEDPDTQPPEVTTVATGSSADVDPPSISPTGGSKDYLFLALGTSGAGGATGSNTWPSNYDDGQATASSTGGTSGSRSSVYGAGRELTASSDDPGTFTLGAGRVWSAYTVAVHPAAAPPATASGNLLLLGVG